MIDIQSLNLWLWGVKLASANVGWSNSVLTLPWYCAYLLGRILKELRDKK